MNTRSRSRQRGAAALVVAMVLLFAMTIVAFFANRTMIFEQRTSANQYRYTKAFEMADAGIEWAIARLNDPRTLPADRCEQPPNGVGLVESFRSRYVRPSAADATRATGWLNPLRTAFPGCQVNPSNGQLSCDCPSAGPAILATTTQPRFRVAFGPAFIPGTPPLQDWQAVEITSRGCTNADPCDPTPPPGAVSTTTDGTAVARVLVKIRPTFPTLPGAGVISGSTTLAGGSINVVNTDTRSNGITINAGNTVEINGSGFTVQSLPGTAAAQSILDNDRSLLRLINADANGELFFSSFFGQGFTAYQNDLGTKVLSSGASAYAAGTCSGASDCAKAVSYWVDRGFRQFWVAGAVDFGASDMPSTTGGTLGTANNPIALATGGILSFGTGVTAYGIYYAATATVNTAATLGNSNPTIVGSFISRGDINKQGAGNLSVVYNSNLFGAAGPPSGLLVPVPGSWRDKLTPYGSF